MATSDTVPGSWVVLLKPYVSEDGLASFTEAVQTAIQDPSKPHIKQKFNLPECRGFSGEFDLDTKEGTEKMDTVCISLRCDYTLLALTALCRSSPLSLFVSSIIATG